MRILKKIGLFVLISSISFTCLANELYADNNDDVKKFMADCYNLLGEFIKIDENRPSIDGKRVYIRNYSKIILDCMD